MRFLLSAVVALFFYQYIFALPMDKKSGKAEAAPNADSKIEKEIEDNLGLEYGRYLQEVVNALEEDKDFSKKLENSSAEDIKSGKIAGELDFVHHNVRTKLDELKRVEMDRLHSLLKQEHQMQQMGGSYVERDGRKWRTVHKLSPQNLHQQLSKYEHIDHNDPHRFSKEDLHRLIVKATADLEELDKKRREEFKQYEMEKEFQYQQSLKNLTEEDRKEAVKKHDEQAAKHKQHSRMHHPGSKQQFEEVWEEQDHMPKEEFNPKTFFSLHDVNNDGVLDQEEVEALLSLEIKKLYDPNNPEDDPNEMMEEYHRMREHIYKEADTDHDGLISRKEFLDLTARADFQKDDGWKGLDESAVYTPEEMKEYEKHRAEAMAHQYGYYVPEFHGQPPQHPSQFVPYQGHPPPPQHPGQFNQPPPVGYQQAGYQPPQPIYQNPPPQGHYQPAYPQGAYPQYQQPGIPAQQQYAQQPAIGGPQNNQQHPAALPQAGQQAPQQPYGQPHPGVAQPQYNQQAPPQPQNGYAQPAYQQPNAQYKAPGASQTTYQQPPVVSHGINPPQPGYQQGYQPPPQNNYQQAPQAAAASHDTPAASAQKP